MRVVADVKDTYPSPSVYIERAAIAGVMALVNKTVFSDADDFLLKRFPKDTITRSVLRGVAPVGQTDAAGWAQEIVPAALRNYLVSLVPESAAAELIRRGVDASLSRYGTAIYPTRSGAPAAAPWVDESGAIPVVQRAFSSVTIGPAKKIALISTLTEELAKRANGEAIISQLMREDVAAGLDLAYFSTTAPSDAAHAGLLYGVSPLSGYAGGDLLSVTNDLARLASAVAANGSGQVLFVMSPQNAAVFPINYPDLAARVTVLASPAVSNTRVIAADPLSILHAVDPAPDIDVSNDAVLHMSDTPLEIVSDTGPTTADPVRSMFQTGAIAIRIMADIAFAKRRAGAVAYIEDITWGVA